MTASREALACYCLFGFLLLIRVVPLSPGVGDITKTDADKVQQDHRRHDQSLIDRVNGGRNGGSDNGNDYDSQPPLLGQYLGFDNPNGG